MTTRIFFSSNGEPIAFLDSKNVFTLDGMWVGYSPDSSTLYDKSGSFIGQFLEDGRIAFDASKPPPAPIQPPQPAVANGIPYAIPHRPALPRLPKPFKEPSLEAQDGNTRPLTFVATQIGLLALLSGAVAFAVWRVASADSSAVTQITAVASFVVTALMALLLAAGLTAFRNSTPRGRRLLLVGTAERRARIAKLLADINLWGASIVHVESDVKPTVSTAPFARSLAESKACDYVLLANALNESDGSFAPRFLPPESSAARASKLVDLPGLLERERGQLIPDLESTAQFFRSLPARRAHANAFGKRALDMVVASVFLWAAAPIMLLTAILIKLESPGPVLYRQERIGLFGNPFFIYRFRSMRLDAEKDGKPQWATGNDSRITRVGRVIRQLRIDELPQLMSVLRGDMSIIGPRPERRIFVEALTEQIPSYRWRNYTKPGISGWAQVRYSYGATIEDAYQKLGYDLYYIKHQSVILDLVILFETVGVVLTGKVAR